MSDRSSLALPSLPAFLELKLQLSRWRDQWWWLMLGPSLLAAGFLLTVWWGGLSYLRNEREATLAGAVAAQSNLVGIVADSLERTLERTLIYARLGEVWLDSKGRASPLLLPGELGDRAFLRVLLIGSDGQQRFPPPRGDENAPLLALLAPTKHTTTAGLHSLRVALPPDPRQSWQIPVIAPVGDPLRPRAHVITLLDLGYFLQLVASVDLGRDARLEVFTADGYRLVESRGLTFSAGGNQADPRWWQALSRQASGHASLPSEQGQPLETAWATLDNYGLKVVASRPRTTILSAQSARQRAYLSWATVLSLALFVTAWSLARAAHHQRGILHRLKRSEADKQALISQLEQEKAHAYRLASHDYLTGLPNRLLFQDLADQLITPQRHGRNTHALLFVDLDRFKLINDTLGHRAGDQLLRTVAKRLRAAMRETDVVSRQGGDEFVLLARDVNHAEEAAGIARKVIDRISEPMLLEGESVQVRPSIGIALYPRDGGDAETLMRHADLAMYEAKRAGRATWRFFDAPRDSLETGLSALRQRLPRAISGGELRLHYQPKVSLRDYRITGLEALIRWQHPEQGLLSPGTFIPLVEDDELILEIGLWAARNACQQLDNWRHRGIPIVPVAINISARQLRDPGFAHTLRQILASLDIPPDLLEIEITESSVMDALPDVDQNVRQLQEMGVSIALDDYGTGFASLSQIRRLPLGTLKIDRSFIEGVVSGGHDEVIVSSTIAMAHNLGLTVVAEGVETREQLIHLKTRGCDAVQGFLLHRPAPPNLIEEALHRGYCPPP